MGRLRIVILSCLLASTALATPPGDPRGFTEGANHHIGNAGFLALHDRAPTEHDGDHDLVRAHFLYARALLSSRPATKPELEARRAELLSYFDQYIAAGVTPKNTYVPWRSPVFIDAKGQICAVGYLIERTAGRDLAEKIAKHHRVAYIEDIAAAEPVVAAWVASSGFTLEELATIQPGYEGPEVGFDHGWDDEALPADGPYTAPDGGMVTNGAFANGKMVGMWTTTDHEGHRVGTGEMKAGSGTWKSTYPDGTRKAIGRYVANHPNGHWTFYHPSGKVAAEGRLDKGLRVGEWTFYADDDAKTVVARGGFTKGMTDGVWKHYDPAGKLLAVTESVAGGKTGKDSYFSETLKLRVTPDAAGVIHEAQSGIPASDWRLDVYRKGKAKLFVDQTGEIRDLDGHMLTHDHGQWMQSDCSWDAARKRAAHSDDITKLSHLVVNGGFSQEADAKCAKSPVAAEKAKELDVLEASRHAVRSPTPAYVRDYLPDEKPTTDAPDPDDTRYKIDTKDLASIIAGNMAWYMEFPHIDGMFTAVHQTLPGFGLRPQ